MNLIDNLVISESCCVFKCQDLKVQTAATVFTEDKVTEIFLCYQMYLKLNFIFNIYKYRKHFLCIIVIFRLYLKKIIIFEKHNDSVLSQQTKIP